MKEYICDGRECVGCSACAQICIKNCITIKEDKEGFLYPQINKNICIDCGLCKKVCPIHHKEDKFEADFYMAWHKNKDILKKSSSGGVFTALSDYVFRRGGVVFGATKDADTWEVYHKMIKKSSELDMLRLSKYYQSNINDVYKQVKEMLEQNLMVLFSGTTCQIAGLYSFIKLQKVSLRYLITVDVLCHGCTNKKLVKNYIKAKEKKYKKKILNYHFRIKTKDVGWEQGGGTRMKLEFSDGSYKIEDNTWDTFFLGFNYNLFLREACYQCKYCGTDRITDFTIGDFWGVKSSKVMDEQLKLGISLMLVNTKEAKKMLLELKEELYMETIEPNEAIPYNLALTKPNNRPKQRDTIFNILEYRNFDMTVKLILKKYYFKQFLKRYLIKVFGDRVFIRLKNLKKKVIKSN